MQGLTPGSRLGPYDIQALIGQGGMGEVYRATDTRLRRDVALKVLPPAFATDADRLARFEREAQVLASLNHPHIASIYGIEEASGTKALVMELVDGPTLADRIAQGRMPLDEALPIARQIAEALEAAHEAGVIHRDLKPANIKLRPDGTVKVLDFGLAKAMEPAASAAALANSPTFTSPAMTHAGVILGTAAYMSPEQARGKPADRRTDIWAFGCVLFEMLTGRAAFGADTISETLAAILRAEPQWELLPSEIHPAVRRLLRRALTKVPSARLAHIADARLELADAGEGRSEDATAPVGRYSLRRWLAAACVATTVLGVATAALWQAYRSRPPVTPEAFDFTLPVGTSLAVELPFPVAVSSDGRTVVINAVTPERSRLLVRTTQSTDWTVISGTDRAGGDAVSSVFLSPDGTSVGFADPVDGTLKKASLEGGAPETICSLGVNAVRNFRGAAWSDDNTIVFASGADSGLMMVPARGGLPVALTRPETGRDAQPFILPGGKVVLFRRDRPAFRSVLMARSLVDGVEREIAPAVGAMADAQDPAYVDGFVIFARGETVWAAPFDVRELRVIGEPFATRVRPAGPLGGRATAFRVAAGGTVVFAPGVQTRRSLVWVDRNGQERPVEGFSGGDYRHVRLSPDGSRIAFEESGDIWVFDVKRQTRTRVTRESSVERFAIWTLDGRRLVFESNRNGVPELFWQAADGSGTAERLVEGDAAITEMHAESFSPDGQQLLFYYARNSQTDLAMITLDAGKTTRRDLTATPFNDAHAVVSPDGQRLAHHASATGVFDVFVQRFPSLEDRQQVSPDGGRNPMWSADGRTLYYTSLDGRTVFAATVTPDPNFEVGVPKPLFTGPYLRSAGSTRTVDLSLDGRFLMIKLEPLEGSGESGRLILIRNWREQVAQTVAN